MSRKILILELWGLGDLTFATPVIRAAIERGDEVHLLGKEHARLLLEPSFPQVKFITYDAPWTVYRGKYQFWKWAWAGLFSVLSRLRKEKYDLAVSVRNDPRDQLFMWLAGARKRLGFVLDGDRRYFDMGALLLTTRLKRPKYKQHKVEDWHQVADAIGLPGAAKARPRIDPTKYATAQGDRIFAGATKPVVCLHTGARIDVRRWPEAYFASIIGEMRKQFDFHLVVIPEPLAPSTMLRDIADIFVTNLSVREMVDVLGRADLLLCNDSGPAHIAAGCGRPVIAIFGPSDPDWFRPWGGESRAVLRDICDWRPCFDYCKFSEPHCMTRLKPDTVWPEIEQHIRSLIAAGSLNSAFVKNHAPAATQV
jgi:ADP-heptose:LPS heptosyltransferase